MSLDQLIYEKIPSLSAGATKDREEIKCLHYRQDNEKLQNIF